MGVPSLGDFGVSEVVKSSEDLAKRMLTVLMPVHNGEMTLEAALTDLASGMQERDELLVVNDGSSDHTPEILEQLAERIPQLRVETTDGVGLVRAGLLHE